MEQLNNCFKIIVTFILAQGENMLPEVKDAIARKCRNILTRLKEPVEGPGASIEPAVDELEKDAPFSIAPVVSKFNSIMDYIGAHAGKISDENKVLITDNLITMIKEVNPTSDVDVFEVVKGVEETDADGNPNPPVSETTEGDDKPVVAP